ncbi:MAG: AccI family restriction endonuclease [Gallionella sp.]
MPLSYKDKIFTLVKHSPFEIDTDVRIEGRPPTMASSEFLTNKQQGDWAEQVVFNAINDYSNDYVAIQYGRSESLAAGDVGFDEFYRSYQEELNTIGKRPDLLIFKKSDIDSSSIDLNDITFVCKAVAAIEVRSSSFLAGKYARYMEERSSAANVECARLRDELVSGGNANLLEEKAPKTFEMLKFATLETFRELDFRAVSWSSTENLRVVSARLKQLKEQIKILHKRDYLSITPKLEDIALVNRWIQKFNVRHYYLQVFFDKAYVIPFKEILEISSDSCKEDVVFSVEKDIKNQGKTTIKINVQVGQEVIGKIEMPEHNSSMKELDRGRLLFFVQFKGGKGYLDHDIFLKKIVNDA